jgi:uncharacterized integral membrane protein
MNPITILKWLFHGILYILAIILLFDNIQIVTFNFFGIYKANLPLIILILIFMLLGVILGYILGLVKSYKNNKKKEK